MWLRQYTLTDGTVVQGIPRTEWFREDRSIPRFYPSKHTADQQRSYIRSKGWEVETTIGNNGGACDVCYQD